MPTIVNVLGFIVCVVLSGIFLTTLRQSFSSGYDYAAVLSLFFFSGFFALLFFILITIQVSQAVIRRGRVMLRPVARLPDYPTAYPRQAGGAKPVTRTARRPMLPQSEFARRWMKRKAMTYEDSLYESRRMGEQRPHRLKCRQLDMFRSQHLWPHDWRRRIRLHRQR